MSELPKGWAASSLSEVSNVVRGITFPASAKENSHTEKNVCCLRTSNIQREVEWGDIYFVDRAFVKRGEQFVQPGDILMSMANSHKLVGKVAITKAVPYPTAFGAFLSAIRPSSAIDGQYLFHLLRTSRVQSELRQGSSQTTNIANISVGTLANIEVPLAPLPEQKRIADKLDSTLARVEACRDRVDRLPALLKRFRQSILAAATSGRLTEDWRTKNSALGDWQPCQIGDLIKGKPRNGYSPKAVEYPTPVKSLTLSATTSGIFRGEHSKFIDEEISPDSHLWLKPGDILIQRANTIEYVGVSAVFTGNACEFIYPDLMMKCEANEKVLTYYLYLLLSAETTRTYFRENATGTAGNMPKINQQTVISAPASLPPKEEQHEIVRRVETLFAFAERLETRLVTARKQAEQLTPALLAKAFRGELVPQDPDDEPASELLKRLAANRTDAPKPKRGRKAAA